MDVEEVEEPRTVICYINFMFNVQLYVLMSFIVTLIINVRWVEFKTNES